METLVTINKKHFKIRTKRDLLSDEFQKILAKSYYGPKRIGMEKIYCDCKKPNGTRVKLYTIKNKRNGRFYLRTYKEQSKYHKFECPFNTQGIEDFISEEKDEIVLHSEDILFKIDKGSEKKKQNSLKSNEINDKHLKRAVRSFNHLIFILMDDAYSLAFNKLNKEVDRLSGSIKMPTFNDFIKIFYGKFLDCKFKNNSNIKQVLKKHNASSFTGIIRYVDTKSNERLVLLKTKNGEFKVDKAIWDTASRYIKIKGNIISPPYFYLAIKKKFVVRLFVFPIAKSKFFIPVESNTERLYVETIDKPMYKPLTVSQMKKVLTKKIARQFYNVVEPDVRPDFFLFDKGKITVVEVYHVNNLNDLSYKFRLYEKEKMYKNLSECFDYKFFEFK